MSNHLNPGPESCTETDRSPGRIFFAANQQISQFFSSVVISQFEV
jgi:hypothetical protein